MATSTEGITISDVRLTKPSPPWKCNPKVKIMINYGSEKRTSKETAFRKRDPCIIWDESFSFAGEPTDDALITLNVVRTHRFIPNHTINSCEHRVIDLLKMQNSSGSCKLDIAENCQLIFKIEKSPNVVLEMVQQASAMLKNLPNLPVPAKAVSLATSAAQAYNDNEDTWSLFIGKFEVFVKMVDEISEISPYVKVAWSVLSVIPKTIIAKKNRDDKIKQLCDKLHDVYDYITDAKRLPKLSKTQSKTLSAVVMQTIECAYFVRAYCTENSAKNTLKGITGSADDKIQDFNNNFDRFMENMEKSVNLETSIVTLRVSEKITELDELALLGEMPYDSNAGYFPSEECLPGTRQKLINDIFEWANNDSSTQILVLSGQAGIGKSAIAHTIAKLFKDQNRLGSMFCFSQGYTGRRNRLFSTISRDLADGDTMWRKELVNVINNNSAVRRKEDIRTQFDELLIKPSKNMGTIGPVVIVVDALDESGDRNERKEILDILLNRWTELSKNYRLIATTRPEQDIEAECQKFGLSITCKRMGDMDVEEANLDIRAYVSKRLESISSHLDEIDNNWRSILATHAQGLFQWAQTACRLIDTTVTRPQLIRENWETCVSNSSSSLYHLYHQIISNQPESRRPSFQEQFKAVVGAIVNAQEPFSILTLQNIFEDIEDIRSILTPFGSFFSGIHNSTGSTPVRPLHTSLFDFFMAEKLSETDEQIPEKINEYYIGTSNQSRMTLGCLKVMNRMLCFNICHLETSHLCNKDVPDFNSRVEKAIPLHLSYSCRFWAFHLQSSPVSGELVREVRRLMDDNLLYYFEALSLMKAVERGYAAMQEIANWCKDAAEDAMDAWKFGSDFEIMMEESTPHLYISALPFVSRDSFVSRKYLERYPGLFTFDVGQPVGPSRKIRFITKEFSLGYPMKIAFSPKGIYMATQSLYSELHVWDYLTREMVFCTADHSQKVFSIVFSPDGELIYCCFLGGEIMIWSMKTKEIDVENYTEIMGAECDFCAISSDGCFIAWRTEKETLLFDRLTRRIVKRFEDNYFPAFSPNGDWIALGHTDKVLIWNTRNQMQHFVPCCDLWNFALTNRYIAFAARKGITIEIRDVRTNTRVTEIQHGKRITSFCLSPDDRFIIVTSARTYSIWSVSTGELISQSYEENPACCLGFSHDSKSIAFLVIDGPVALCTYETLYVREWDKSIEQDHPHSDDIRNVITVWLRGSYLILGYRTILRDYYLQISDITTTSTIIFETKIEDNGPLDVDPDEENVRVAYGNSRGLCLWDEKEGEIIVNGSARSIIALVCLENYFISAHERAITIWDSRTRTLVCGPIDLPQYELKSLLPVRGTQFAVIYEDKAEVWECRPGNRIGEAFAIESKYPHSISISANGKHAICMSEYGVDTLDLTGARVSSLLFSCHDPKRRRSLNGKYMAWIDKGEIKLFDVDTETFVAGPSLDQPAEDFWLSDDSKRITIKFGKEGNPKFLDIWDIQSNNMVTKTIQYPFNKEIKTLILSERCLIVLTGSFGQCHVWDLDTLEVMSTLYTLPPVPASDGSDIEGRSIPYKTESLGYALMAWRKASLSTSTEIDYNGWVFGLRGELLFWVPQRMRKQFWFPCMMHMPYRNFRKLNLSNFVHGLDWTKCKSGNN